MGLSLNPFDCGCDCAGDCGACKNGTAPATLSVEITGTTGTSTSDCDCTDYNGNFEVPFIACSSAADDNFASWAQAGLALGCSATLAVDVAVSWNAVTGTRSITITIQDDSLADFNAIYYLEETSQVEPFDCTTFADLEVPLLSDNGACDAPASVFLSSP